MPPLHNKSSNRKTWIISGLLLVVFGLFASRQNVDMVLMDMEIVMDAVSSVVMDDQGPIPESSGGGTTNTPISSDPVQQSQQARNLAPTKNSEEDEEDDEEDSDEEDEDEKGKEKEEKSKESDKDGEKSKDQKEEIPNEIEPKESSEPKEEEKEEGLTHLYRLPKHLTSEEAYRNHVPPNLKKSSIDLMDTASNSGLQPSKACEEWSEELDKFCEKPGCMVTFPINDTIAPSETTCKTLWFSGMSMGTSSECKQTGYGGYRSDYAIALRTAMHNARDTLQPVLLVGRYLMEDRKLPPVIEWYAEQGVIIITVDAMSFQPMMNEKLKALGLDPGVDTHGGQFLRIDIHQIVKDHKLFDLPGICDRYALYTDSDVMFVNPIRQGDLDKLKKQIDPSTDAYILYGRQTKTSRRPVNNGVMLFDVHRFHQEWPSILKFGTENFPNYSYDQMWFNNYFMSTPERMANRSTLANEWNWKSYWAVKPNEWHQVKLVHSHGPKIGKGLEYMAQCNASEHILRTYGKTYQWFVKLGICCDRGMTAKYMLDLYHELSPPAEIRCTMTMDEM